MGTTLKELRLRAKKRLGCFVGDSECYVAAENVNQRYPSLEYKSGFYVKPDGKAADHAWTQGKDGTIYDTTYSQFNPRVKIGVFRPGSPEHKRYRSYDEHHNPDCLLKKLRVNEPCQVDGCDWRGQ
jgi:hypothetical protein